MPVRLFILEALSDEKAALSTPDTIETEKDADFTEAERGAFDERTAIMQDSGIPEDEARTLAYHSIRPIPLTFVESCERKTPPNGDCRRYTMKLYKPTMSLKQYCKAHKRWCHEVQAEERFGYDVTSVTAGTVNGHETPKS